MFAVIETGGKQYKVAVGQKLKIGKVNVGEGATFTFSKVLLRAEGDKAEIGAPYLAAPVEARILREGRGPKKIIFRFHSKTRYRKKKGYREPYTEVEIVKI